MNRDRRKFLRGMGRWVSVAAVAPFATGCNSPSPTAPGETLLQPLTAGVTSTKMKLIDVLRQAHHKISDANLIAFAKTEFRRFVGLNNEPSTDWYIEIRQQGQTTWTRYGDGTAGSPNIDMPEVELAAGTQWRIAKPQLGFIPALVLVALGWFWHRRNRIAPGGRRVQCLPGGSAIVVHACAAT